MTDSTRTLDVIAVRGLRVDCIVGVYPVERDVPQPLIVDVSLSLDTRPAARSEQLSATLDYARLAGELRFLLERARFRLLETAAEALCAYLLAPPTDDRPHPPVHAVTLTLTKPDALAGDARASLTVTRTPHDLAITHEPRHHGSAELVYLGRDCSIYRLHVRPHGVIATHVHHAMEEHELVLGANLLVQGVAVAPGTAHHWPHGLPHRYDNPSDVEQTVLCINRPRFVASDQVEVEEPAAWSFPPASQYYPVGER